MRKAGGFTLVELIITVAILATLSSVAIVGYTSYVSKANRAAAHTFLNDLKKRILLVSAECGNVDSIEVYPMDGRTLLVKVKAASFADDFADHIQVAFPDAIDIAPNDAVAATAYSFLISVPAGWDESDYANARKLVYSLLTDAWEIYPP